MKSFRNYTIFFLIKPQILFKLLVSIALQCHCTFNPAICMLDFELAVHNVLMVLFTDCIVKGCLFHFSQALLRQPAAVGVFTSSTNFSTMIFLQICFFGITLHNVSKPYTNPTIIRGCFNTTHIFS